MNLHEYQAKALFARFGIPVPVGRVAADSAEAQAAACELGGERWVVKAQVHAGGRGKGGGVVLVDSPEAVAGEAAAPDRQPARHEADRPGRPSDRAGVGRAADGDRPRALPQSARRPRRAARADHGLAGRRDGHRGRGRDDARADLRRARRPRRGLQPYQCRRLGFGLGLTAEQIRPFQKILSGLYRLFTECDASLVEINPLVVTQEGGLLALDAKINLDDNALYRHPDLFALRDVSRGGPAGGQAKSTTSTTSSWTATSGAW